MEKTTITAYHYSSKPFDKFDISKCDGFWFTDINPGNTEMLEEIGASDLNYVAICELDINETLTNGDNYDVEDQLADTEYDALENSYDGFTDYALIDESKIEVIEWKKI